MSRSDRSLVVAAIFGLGAICFGAGLTLGGDWTSQPYEQSGKPYASAQRYRAQPFDSGFTAYPAEESNACYHAKDHDSADLCAQWRAAIAAEKAANSAVWSNRLSVIGALLSAIGLAALLITIRQGRSALRRARKANRISQRIGEAQVRCYPHVDCINVLLAADSFVHLRATISNYGTSPTLDFDAVYVIDIGNAFARQPMHGSFPYRRKFGIPAQNKLELPVQLSSEVASDATAAAFDAGGFASINVRIGCRWKDVFNKQHEEMRHFSRLSANWKRGVWYPLDDDANIMTALSNEIGRRVASGAISPENDPR